MKISWGEKMSKKKKISTMAAPWGRVISDLKRLKNTDLMLKYLSHLNFIDKKQAHKIDVYANQVHYLKTILSQNTTKKNYRRNHHYLGVCKQHNKMEYINLGTGTCQGPIYNISFR